MFGSAALGGALVLCPVQLAHGLLLQKRPATQSLKILLELETQKKYSASRWGKYTDLGDLTGDLGCEYISDSRFEVLMRSKWSNPRLAVGVASRAYLIRVLGCAYISDLRFRVSILIQLRSARQYGPYVRECYSKNCAPIS